MVPATVEAYPCRSLHAVRAGQLKKCLTTTWLASSALLRRELRGSRSPQHGESTLLVSLVCWIRLTLKDLMHGAVEAGLPSSSWYEFWAEYYNAHDNGWTGLASHLDRGQYLSCSHAATQKVRMDFRQEKSIGGNFADKGLWRSWERGAAFPRDIHAFHHVRKP